MVVLLRQLWWEEDMIDDIWQTVSRGHFAMLLSMVGLWAYQKLRMSLGAGIVVCGLAEGPVAFLIKLEWRRALILAI
jgi:hypothetical protein